MTAARGLAPLRDAADEARFGGKAAQLASALRAGLPVPRGFALPASAVARIAAGDGDAREEAARAWTLLGGRPLAVRSSAVGEDSASASFAGQHLTRLNVVGAEALLAAIAEVWSSGRTEAALAYRARLGIARAPEVAVVIQEMVQAECAGVLFTRDPVDGSDQRVIEAAWGLGEAVVAGLVEPDRFRLARGGTVRAAVVGDKDVCVRVCADGGTEEVPVEPHLRRAPCLDPARLALLDRLADRCEAHFEGAHDIEWAFSRERCLHLLQRRAITR